MKLCRFAPSAGSPRVGLLSADSRQILDLTSERWPRLDVLLEERGLAARLARADRAGLPTFAVEDVTLLAPVDEQEVWAAGVTYQRSRLARMDESDFSAIAYDRVYRAARPEIFFKSVAHKVVGPGAPIGIRRDSKWNVPEPELALIFNSRGERVGYTAGNDVSSRDIEGANLLYLPQAKVYDRACALGPWVVVGESEAAARRWTVTLEIRRRGRKIFSGSTQVARIRRRFAELGGYLFRSQTFARGAVLLTGTGIVPDAPFTLRRGDGVTVAISGIGALVNPVTVV
jgi:2-dehydro-3-deoxy-D-arabinonate dehydratase